MSTARRLMTTDELAALPDDGRRYELPDGVLHELAPNNEVHDDVRTLVAISIGGCVLTNKLGRVMTGETGYYRRRDPGRLRAPDLAFKSNEQVGTEGLSRDISDVLPDLVVNIVSPGDTATEIEQKLQEWLSAGVRLVLVLYTDTRSVMAH